MEKDPLSVRSLVVREDSLAGPDCWPSIGANESASCARGLVVRGEQGSRHGAAIVVKGGEHVCSGDPNDV